MIISCDNDIFSDKTLWNKIASKNINNYLIISGKKITKNYILENKNLYLNCNDYYEGLPEKILCGIKAILNIEKFNNITHIMKIDIKNFINEMNNKVIEKINNIIKHTPYDYMGQIINSWVLANRGYALNRCSPNSTWNNKKYSGKFPKKWIDGESYILSRKALMIIVEYFSKYNKLYISQNFIAEDVMIALILLDHNIYPKKINYNNKSYIKSKIDKYFFGK